MKRRGWWIAGGIILLWISPLFWGIGSSLLKEKKDYSEDWKRYNEELNRPAYEAAVHRWKKAHGYFTSGSTIDSRRDEPSCGGSEVVVVEKPVYVERVVYRDNPSSQPDLSGIYYNIPLTGPNNGNVQFNAIGGPY